MCLNTSTIRPTSLLDKIAIAAQTGYEAIELWIDDLMAFQGAGGRLTEVVGRLHQHGLSVPDVIALHGWTDAPDAEWPGVLEEARRAMDFAAQVGARHIVASPAQGRVDLARAARRYAELLSLGRTMGVLPAMEFLGFVDHIRDIKTAWSIVEEAGDPDGSLVLDAFHQYNGGSSLQDLAALPMERVAIFHMDDAPATPAPGHLADEDRVYPGEGVIDLTAMLRLLRDGGYRGPLSLELFNPGYWREDPRQVAARGLAAIRHLIQALDT
jgi:sugar phosphate isomerase/epimerase